MNAYNDDDNHNKDSSDSIIDSIDKSGSANTSDSTGIIASADTSDSAPKNTVDNNLSPNPPARYKLYDGIKDKVSLRTMDIIIFAIITIIVILLLIGLFGDKPKSAINS